MPKESKIKKCIYCEKKINKKDRYVIEEKRDIDTYQCTFLDSPENIHYFIGKPYKLFWHLNCYEVIYA